MSNQRWMIYGATGYSGRLIAEEAARRGHKPVLAGRNKNKLTALGERLGLDSLPLSLDDPPVLARALKDIDLVLHCAGPFQWTAMPMLRACLTAGAHYLDITGEIPVIENAFAFDSAARAKGVAIIPGCGFDVVPTDCLALYVTGKIAKAVVLEIAFTGKGMGISGGTAVSGIEMLPGGGLERRDGRLSALPLGVGVIPVAFPFGQRHVMPIPWGDLATAYRSTGVPNITTYVGMSRTLAGLIRIAGPLTQVLLLATPLRRLLQAITRVLLRGPGQRARQAGRMTVWARAVDMLGKSAEAWLELPEAYTFTALAAVNCVERTLAENPKGALSPAMAFGADFVLSIEGVRRLDQIG
jgi:short subunit dehydrogenase-like uncharacterized protein